MQSAHVRNSQPVLRLLPCEMDVNSPEPTAIELHLRYDHLFKEIVTSGWANESSGNVEAPSGAFAKIEVGSDRAAMRDMLDHHDSDGILNTSLFDELEDGWYLTKEDSDGIVFVFFDSEVNIQRAYAYLESEYADYLGTEYVE